MTGQKKGWMIIAFDLIIVLIVYFVYSQFVLTQNPNTIQARDNGISYTLKLHPPTNNSIKFTFQISSRRHQPHEVPLPNGITLLLSDGDVRYWKEPLSLPDPITVQPSETRQWSTTAPLPDNSSSVLYGGFFIDTDRQKTVRVPGIAGD